MFEFIRHHNKIIMAVLFLMVIPSFVLFGVDRYQHGGGQAETVASVAGETISRTQWDERHRAESDRMRQQAPGIDTALLDSDSARYATLERMVRDRVLAVAATKENLSVSDERLSRTFSQDPGLAAFRGPDGKFDRDRFISATRQTPEQYEASMRFQMSTQQVLQGVAGSTFVGKAQADATLSAFYDRREVRVAEFKPASFESKANPSDDDLKAYYAAHTSQFQAKEQVDVEYLVLDKESLSQGLVVSDADIKNYYEQNKDRLGTKEQRRASHILVAVAPDASPEERKVARAKAEALLAKVKADPASFADVARKESQDPGSAAQGGDLDYVTRGAMVKPFEDALFALAPGGISGIVETDFGFHIVELKDIKPGEVPPLAQQRADIERDIRSQQATQAFAKAAEQFTDIVFQQADSLAPAADKLKLKIRTANGVLRVPAPDAKGPLANRRFLESLFAPDAVDAKHNTEAIETGPSELSAGRVTRYAKARALPFDEVKAQVRTEWMAQRSAELAKAAGAEKLKAWDAAQTVDPAFGPSQTVSRIDQKNVAQPVIEAALRADASKLPVLVGVDLGAAGYAIVRVEKNEARAAPTAEAATQELAQLTQVVANAESAAYYQMLKQRYDVKFEVPVPNNAEVTGSKR